EVWFNHATFFHHTTLPTDVREGLLAVLDVEDLPTNTYFGDGGSDTVSNWCAFVNVHSANCPFCGVTLPTPPIPGIHCPLLPLTAIVVRMPTQKHDISAELFRWSPDLAAELLAEMGINMPKIRQAHDVSESFTDLKTREYKGDVAIVLDTGDSRTGVVVEVQHKKDEDKQWTWPLYIATLRNRQRCPVILLVIAPDPKVAEWCGRTIETGHPGHDLTPLVLHSKHIPVMLDPEEIAADPAMGVLSVLFHGAGEHGPQIVRAAYESTNLLAARGDERARRYYDYVLVMLPEAARKSLEAKMMTDSPYYSDVMRGAEARGEARSVLLVLKARGIETTDEDRERIEGCTDQSQLETWLQRAAIAQKADELFV
ncbi:hypothetical protein, partial [Actinomadura rubrisoli]|uniref:hypothetical protein n=1 Tax=Actinomadura rubrisoli TaxID=2530368 RepID=UPI001A9E9DD7